jgi:hypothetical protein
VKRVNRRPGTNPRCHCEFDDCHPLLSAIRCAHHPQSLLGHVRRDRLNTDRPAPMASGETIKSLRQSPIVHDFLHPNRHHLRTSASEFSRWVDLLSGTARIPPVSVRHQPPRQSTFVFCYSENRLAVLALRSFCGRYLTREILLNRLVTRVGIRQGRNPKKTARQIPEIGKKFGEFTRSLRIAKKFA